MAQRSPGQPIASLTKTLGSGGLTWLRVMVYVVMAVFAVFTVLVLWLALA